MNAKDYKLTAFKTRIIDLPDRIVGQAADLKRTFDDRGDELQEAFNTFLEKLGSEDGASLILAKNWNEEVISVQTHIKSQLNPHRVTAAQVGAYSKDETDQCIAERIAQMESTDAGISLYTHTKSGTVHNFKGSGSNGKALITDAFVAGDTFTVNGKAANAFCGADGVDGDTIVKDRWVSFTYDGAQLNFKGGGGLGNTKLGLATAGAAHVLAGKTFYSGNKILKTGTLPEFTAQNVKAKGIYGGKTGDFLNFYIERGGYTYNGNVYVYMPKTDVTEAIGLDHSKLLNSQTVLGKAGTLAERNGQYTMCDGVAVGDYVAYKIPKGAYTYSGTPYLRAAKADVAEAIGLTAGKVAAGNTVLGIVGSVWVPVAVALACAATCGESGLAITRGTVITSGYGSFSGGNSYDSGSEVAGKDVTSKLVFTVAKAGKYRVSGAQNTNVKFVEPGGSGSNHGTSGTEATSYAAGAVSLAVGSTIEITATADGVNYDGTNCGSLSGRAVLIAYVGA